MSEETLAGVLAEHRDCGIGDSATSSVDTAVDAWTCGLRLPFCETLDEAYDAHQAAAVLDWLRARLASDEVREAVWLAIDNRNAEELIAAWKAEGDDATIECDYEADADAALTAVLAALEVER